MHYDCLIVDDEALIAQSTCEYFNLFEVSAAYVTGYGECLDFLKGNTVSLLLLDINLGNRSGFSLCKKLREKNNLPILFLSARTSDDDILTALNIGGDDYITKPYSLSILLAKVKAVLRRCCGPQTDSLLASGRIRIDKTARKISIDGTDVHFKELEYRLLVYLMENTGRVITKEELLNKVWPDPFVGDGTLSVHIRHLREKIEKDPNSPKLLLTVWGVGYRMETGDDI